MSALVADRHEQQGAAGKGKEKLLDDSDGEEHGNDDIGSTRTDRETENRKPKQPTTPGGPLSAFSWQSPSDNRVELARKEEHDGRSPKPYFPPLALLSPARPLSDVRNRREMLHFLCPLTRGIFKDPVFCADGHTYERQAIKLYLKGHHRSPLTGLTFFPISRPPPALLGLTTLAHIARAGQRLDHKTLTPNYHLRKLLAAKREYDPVFSNVNFFAVLPHELLCLIFSKLDTVSLGRVMMVRAPPLLGELSCLTRTHAPRCVACSRKCSETTCSGDSCWRATYPASPSTTRSRARATLSSSSATAASVECGTTSTWRNIARPPSPSSRPDPPARAHSQLGALSL
jgi:hypothetical protein